MFSTQTRVWILLFGVCLRNSLAVVNQKIDNYGIPAETSVLTSAYGVPVSSESADPLPLQHRFNNDYGARISDFEATTPVFPLTAPPYDYSPPGLSPPEGDNISSQDSGYSYISPLTTTEAPNTEPISTQPNGSYLPPIETNYKPSTPSFIAPKPSYLPPTPPPPHTPTYLPPPPKPTYDSPPSKLTYGSFAFQHYPIRPQYSSSQSSYSSPQRSYVPPPVHYDHLQQYLSPQKSLSSYLTPSKQDYTFLSSQRNSSPLSKFSFYTNLKNGIYSLIGSRSQYGSPDIQSPPTPPVITYDGWRPMEVGELKNIRFDSYAVGTYSNSPFSQNIFGIETEQQHFPKLNNYYPLDNALHSDQIPVSKYEVPFDFVKSFSNLALNSYDKELQFGELPNASLKPSLGSGHAQYCGEHSLVQSTPHFYSNTLKNSYQNLNQPTEQLGLTYGVPSGKQIEGPKLHPKIPVKFRAPVPSGLLESIGKKDQNSYSQSTEFRGQTYIPPAIPEVSKSNEASSNSLQYSNTYQEQREDHVEAFNTKQPKGNSYDTASFVLEQSSKPDISSPDVQYLQSYKNPSDFTPPSNTDYSSDLRPIDNPATNVNFPHQSLDESFLHTLDNLSPALQPSIVTSQTTQLSTNHDDNTGHTLHAGDYNVEIGLSDNAHPSPHTQHDQVFSQALLQDILSVIEKQQTRENYQEKLPRLGTAAPSSILYKIRNERQVDEAVNTRTNKNVDDGLLYVHLQNRGDALSQVKESSSNINDQPLEKQFETKTEDLNKKSTLQGDNELQKSPSSSSLR